LFLLIKKEKKKKKTTHRQIIQIDEDLYPRGPKQVKHVCGLIDGRFTQH